MANKHGEAENYQGSISDLMAGLTFIFIITCMVFMIKLKEAEKNESKIKEEAGEYAKVRAELLDTLRKELKSDVQVHVDFENGILRLQDGKNPFFLQGEHKLTEHGREVVTKIASRLRLFLNCKESPIQKICDNNGGLKVENIFIEGHADQAPLEGQRKQVYEDNLGLSSQRAKYAYGIFREVFNDDGLKSLRNQNNESILNISAYGDTRLIRSEPNYIDLPSDQKRLIDKENRRIDLRFIMHQPLNLRGLSSEG
ncbi:MAG: flagellar motor protein MotB [Bacteriovoracia bacterium]